MGPEFRILALTGGGGRGVFQARLLEVMEETHACRLHEQFDLIAATSTGSILGLALANGTPASNIVHLYRDHAQHVFRSRRFGWFRRGGRYSHQVLADLLDRQFGDRRLGDLRTDVIVTSSVVDTFQGRCFTRADRNVSVADAAMASCAAPTYFPPSQLRGQGRGHMDGGLWANDPSFVAVSHAVNVLGVRADRIRLLTVGTGRVERGVPTGVMRVRPAASAASLRFLFDFMSGTQAWYAQQLCKDFLTPDQMVRVNPYLGQWIPLDAASRALLVLPALAECEYERYAEELAVFVRERQGASSTGRF